MMDLNDMVVFAKVAELKGISPAARALGVPKSKVSRRMASLETALGVRLLERTTRAVHLTELGQIYYQHCKRVSEEAQSAVESVNRLLDVPRGHLRISTSVAIGQYFIGPHLSDFIRAYPEIEVDISLTNRRVDIIAEGYDLAIRVGELQDSTLVSKRLATRCAKLYAAPDYLDEMASLRRLEDLHKHRTLTMSERDTADQWLLQHRDGHQQSVALAPVLRLNDMAMLLKVAETGGGVALLPSYLAQQSVDAGILREVLPSWQSPDFNFYALYPSHQGLTRKVRAWIDFFADKLS
jgi:LysR family transcriptional regulator AphB